MCALSATLAEKIGHHTHFQQPGVWHKSYHLQPILLFFPPFLGDVRDVPISMTDMAREGGGNHPCAMLTESD